MSPADALLARGRAVMDVTLYHEWNIEGSAAVYRGQFDTRMDPSLGLGGWIPDTVASLVVSTAAVQASGIAIQSRVVIDGKTYVVRGASPQPQATEFHLADPNT